MKNFLRSLRYLKPYRVRLGVSILCVILIAILWGGGLAGILPGAKILISQEGLHGWAWSTMTEDRLGIGVVQRLAPESERIEGQSLSWVLDVVSVDEDGPAARTIGKTEWIVGFDGDPLEDRVLRGDIVARRIAEMPSGATVTLRVYDPGRGPGEQNPRSVTLRLQEAKPGSRVLASFARRLPEDRYALLLLLLGFGVGITLARGVLRFAQEYLVESVVWRGTMDLRCENYNVVLRLPTTFFSSQGVSDTMSRFVQDTAELARGQVTLFGKTLVEPAKAIASVIVALALSWQLTLLVMVAGPPSFFLIRRLGKVMKRASRRALESWSAILGILEETLNGIRVVKAYTMEASERRRFLSVNRRLYKQQRRMARIDAAISPAIEAMGIIAAMGAVAVAGYWVIQHQNGMNPEKFIALMGCLAAMFDPVRKLAKVSMRFQRAEAAAARIFELQDQPQEKRTPGAPALPRHRRSIEFRDVRFRYPRASEDALADINVTIEAGESVAIVGPNGCGKTTLVSLVPRLLDPTEGELLVDGRPVAEASIRSLRRQIALVTQETVLFHATIAENISYGLRRPDRDDVLDAARKAYVDEFVREMPDGYETMVGEHGATLSGGQRQRIAIARAILRDPAILIFDEATSQIDADSERRIYQAMTEFMCGRTTLTIAHHFATIQSATRILVMDNGRIVGSGKHPALLETCPVYRHLYQTQFGLDA